MATAVAVDGPRRREAAGRRSRIRHSQSIVPDAKFSGLSLATTPRVHGNTDASGNRRLPRFIALRNGLPLTEPRVVGSGARAQLEHTPQWASGGRRCGCRDTRQRKKPAGRQKNPLNFRRRFTPVLEAKPRDGWRSGKHGLPCPKRGLSGIDSPVDCLRLTRIDNVRGFRTRSIRAAGIVNVTTAFGPFAGEAITRTCRSARWPRRQSRRRGARRWPSGY
jgi:hypothetical protein